MAVAVAGSWLWNHGRRFLLADLQVHRVRLQGRREGSFPMTRSDSCPRHPPPRRHIGPREGKWPLGTTERVHGRDGNEAE